VTELCRLSLNHASTATALIAGDEHWTYGSLNDAVRSLAAAMGRDGLAGERVAMMLPNGSDAVVTYLACFASGAVAAPLNSRYAAPEAEHALRRARPRWLVVHPSRLGTPAAIEPAALDGVRVLVSGAAATRTGYGPLGPLLGGPGEDPPSAAGGAPAVIFFTSGSTGVPKGVVHSHDSALAILTSTSEALGNVRADDVVQVFEPLVHVSGFIAALTTLLAGGTVALHDGFDATAYVAALRTHQPTLICTHIDLVAQVLRVAGIDSATFASLRGVYTGGDSVPAALQREFKELTGLPIGVGWGMTEAIWLTIAREPPIDRDGCIGVPVGGAEIRADAHTDELLVRGPMVMQQYWGDPELTAATLHDGWLRTGDLGRVDASGVWWFTGRIKDIIVRRTSKITPGEVESALEQHPNVAIAAVVAAPDPDEGQVPVAFVVPKAGASLTSIELVDYLRTRIAAYKIPARIHLRDALPLTASGKISRHDLHEDI
jgi:long-chain acyl-CoA synthetase